LSSNRSLWESRDQSYATYLVGDARNPRRIINAIHEANHIARFEI
jgi:hypothetical protein